METLKAIVARAHTMMEAVGVGVEHVAVTGLILLGGLVAVAVALRFIRPRLRKLHRDRGVSLETIVGVERWTTVTLWVVVMIVLFDYWDFGFGRIWAALISVLGVVGVGLLATWTMASNFTASTLLAITRPFELGQKIEILPEGVRGRAVERNIMFTILREDGGGTISVPNNAIFQRIVRCEAGRRRHSIDDYDDPDGGAAHPLPGDARPEQDG